MTDDQHTQSNLFDDTDILSDLLPKTQHIVKYSDTDDGTLNPVNGFIRLVSFERLHLALPTPTSDDTGIMLTIKCDIGHGHTITGVFGRMYDDDTTPARLQRIVFNDTGSSVALINGRDRWLILSHYNMSTADTDDRQ